MILTVVYSSNQNFMKTFSHSLDDKTLDTFINDRYVQTRSILIVLFFVTEDVQ